MENYEHPEITLALRTGFPSWMQECELPACDYCRSQEEVLVRVQCADEQWRNLCKSCFRDEIREIVDEMSDSGLMELFDCEYVEVEM